jgi:CheY-like chemotaxis protein
MSRNNNHQLSNLKVLIADDHLLIHQLVGNMLRDFQITDIQTAASGHRAIDLIQQATGAGQPYDIVFLDWNMPTLSGLEVLSYFRAKPEYATTAFVMLSSQCEQQDVMKAIKAGATSYIIKPVSTSQLSVKLMEIHAWIRSSRSRKTP